MIYKTLKEVFMKLNEEEIDQESSEPKKQEEEPAVKSPESSSDNNIEKAEPKDDEIELTTHLDYPDVVTCKPFGLARVNPGGTTHTLIRFNKDTVNNLPYPFKVYRSTKPTEGAIGAAARVCFLTPQDANGFPDNVSHPCVHSSDTHTLVRIDINGNIPCYATLQHLQSFPSSVIHPIIQKRMKEKAVIGNPFYHEEETKPKSTEVRVSAKDAFRLEAYYTELQRLGFKMHVELDEFVKTVKSYKALASLPFSKCPGVEKGKRIPKPVKGYLDNDRTWGECSDLIICDECYDALKDYVIVIYKPQAAPTKLFYGLCSPDYDIENINPDLNNSPYATGHSWELSSTCRQILEKIEITLDGKQGFYPAIASKISQLKGISASFQFNRYAYIGNFATLNATYQIWFPDQSGVGKEGSCHIDHAQDWDAKRFSSSSIESDLYNWIIPDIVIPICSPNGTAILEPSIIKLAEFIFDEDTLNLVENEMTQEHILVSELTE